jgi:hypothetical protein
MRRFHLTVILFAAAASLFVESDLRMLMMALSDDHHRVLPGRRSGWRPLLRAGQTASASER